MLVQKYLSALLLGAPALASHSGGSKTCMTPAQATKVALYWPQLIGNYTKAFADAVLEPDYSDFSESALSLNAVCPQVNGTAPPLTAPVFTSRQQFEEGQGPQPPIDSQILNIWPACMEVTLRYNMTNLGTRPVITVIAIEAQKAPHDKQHPFHIKTTYSEFDSEAWVQNLMDSGHCGNSSSS